MVGIGPYAAAEDGHNLEDPNPQTGNVRRKRYLRGNALRREPVNNGSFGR